MSQAATRTDWFPNRLADQAEMFANVKAKIAGYTAILPITAAQTTAITLLCNEFAAIYNYVLQARSTTEGLVEWRDLVFKGPITGTFAPLPPAYPTYVPVIGGTLRVFAQFRDYVDLIKASPGYTRAIGEDLMIVAVKPDELVEGEVTPELRVATSSGYKVEVSGSLQGMDALRVEYVRSGSSTWNIAAFLTKMPGEFTISPATPGQPESGRIRGVFIKKNEEFGNFSPEYPITLS